MAVSTGLAEVYPGPPVPLGWKLLVEARLESPNLPATDLALAVGVSAQTIRIWTRKPEYQRYENWRMKGEYDRIVAVGQQDRTALERTKDAVTEYAEECFERLKLILETTQDDKFAAALSQDILDRAGVAPVKEIKHSGQRAMILTPEVVEMFAQRAREAGVQPVIEAEYSEDRSIAS